MGFTRKITKKYLTCHPKNDSMMKTLALFSVFVCIFVGLRAQELNTILLHLPDVKRGIAGNDGAGANVVQRGNIRKRD